MAGNIKSKFVIDASFLLSFIFPDEKNNSTYDFFDQFKNGEIEFYSTQLLPFEIANSLLMAIRRKRYSPKYSKSFLKDFLNYKIVLEEVDFSKCLNLAVSKDLTLYDSSYLYLAQNKKIPLLTLDNKLQKLAPRFN